ncbi:hypothetical protein TRVL_07184 [Trypanosoma vivax]|nr:hypothetical protein TRVL_07184 [Trypanosoma vivax]
MQSDPTPARTLCNTFFLNKVRATFLNPAAYWPGVSSDPLKFHTIFRPPFPFSPSTGGFSNTLSTPGPPIVRVACVAIKAPTLYLLVICFLRSLPPPPTTAQRYWEPLANKIRKSLKSSTPFCGLPRKPKEPRLSSPVAQR